ncbi:low affinity immunoglobulin epsilon Fc receptor-like [Macrobrachium rosenbergii]|uniref:low affinity immunoglobulin epsilon Fc receptor-like n=1 Tax=Macrobrachium rosenbergii TaxID=79674 RepID=UPI0034D6854A
MRATTKCLCTCAITLAMVCAVTSAVAQKNLPRPLPGSDVIRNSAVLNEGKRYGSSVRNDVRRYDSVPSMHVSDGHRLITRALWRIFDALMQKKDHSALYSRMTFVEEALKKMISVDSQLEDEIDKLKDDMVACKAELSALTEELGRVKSINSRLQLLEEAYSRVSVSDAAEPQPQPQPQGDQHQAGWAAAAYSSCPAPFEKVGGECFYLAATEMKGWEDARRECGRLGGDLASPRSLRDLRIHLNSTANAPEYLWVGGSKSTDGSWVWSSGPMAGIPVDMSKETWNDEVPSGPGRCMGLFKQRAYRAYNYDCKELDYFVCQYFF